MGTTKKRVLFISGSLGLGHITRDLAIAAELRKLNPDIELSWLAAHPASLAIKNAGEHLLPENDLLSDYTVAAEQAAKKTQLNLMHYALRVMKAFIHNAFFVNKVTQDRHFDLIIGDETYELMITQSFRMIHFKVPFVMIYDFVGFDAMSGSFLEKIQVNFWNWVWSQDRRIYSNKKNIAIFIGERKDVPEKNWGFPITDRRWHAQTYYHFISNVLQFNPQDYFDCSKIKAHLGYGPEPLVICSIGGTDIGKQLLHLCGKAYPIIREKIPDLKMVLVCGPRLSAGSLDIPLGPDVREYVPDLYQHFAACDLAVVQCGGTSTLELTALRRPFLYFPLEGHCEQELAVVPRLIRHQAGIRMSYSKTTPESLAQQIISNLGKVVDYAHVPMNGATEAARLINIKLGQHIEA